MRLAHVDACADKGWLVGPWNSTLTLALGYGHRGGNEPHLHRATTEIYMVARGRAIVRVERESIALQAGDVLIVEPGEAHTFLQTSPDFADFVVQTPGLPAEQARADKVLVHGKRLGLS